jgi:hypothetical protein
MTTHILKSWPEFFAPLAAGTKNFDLRKNDRQFKVGDILRLREWEPMKPTSQQYTGREVVRRVGFVMEGVGPGAIAPYHGLVREYVILGLDKETDALVETIFQALDPNERDGDNAVFSSGYGSGPIIINVRALAEAL